MPRLASPSQPRGKFEGVFAKEKHWPRSISEKVRDSEGLRSGLLDVRRLLARRVSIPERWEPIPSSLLLIPGEGHRIPTRSHRGPTRSAFDPDASGCEAERVSIDARRGASQPRAFSSLPDPPPLRSQRFGMRSRRLGMRSLPAWRASELRRDRSGRGVFEESPRRAAEARREKELAEVRHLADTLGG